MRLAGGAPFKRGARALVHLDISRRLVLDNSRWVQEDPSVFIDGECAARAVEDAERKDADIGELHN